jgi:hypothetical protein
VALPGPNQTARSWRAQERQHNLIILLMNIFSYINKIPYGAVGYPALPGQEIKPL